MDDDGVFRLAVQQDDRMACRLPRQAPDIGGADPGVLQPVHYPVIARAHGPDVMGDRTRAGGGNGLVRALAPQALDIAAGGQRLARTGQVIQPINMVDIDRPQVPDRHVFPSDIRCGHGGGGPRGLSSNERRAPKRGASGYFIGDRISDAASCPCAAPRAACWSDTEARSARSAATPPPGPPACGRSAWARRSTS